MFGFKWILKDQLAAGCQPGLYKDWEEDVSFLRVRGIDYLISLTEEPLLKEAAAKVGFGFYHFPIRDMDIPMPRDASKAIHELNQILQEHHVPLIHCKAGLGRTGMIAACFMVSRGQTPEEAITYVRKIQPKFIQTRNQENFIYNFSSFHNDENLEYS